MATTMSSLIVPAETNTTVHMTASTLSSLHGIATRSGLTITEVFANAIGTARLVDGTLECGGELFVEDHTKGLLQRVGRAEFLKYVGRDASSANAVTIDLNEEQQANFEMKIRRLGSIVAAAAWVVAVEEAVESYASAGLYLAIRLPSHKGDIRRLRVRTPSVAVQSANPAISPIQRRARALREHSGIEEG